MKKRVLRGGNSGRIVRGKLQGDASGCLRKILLRDHKIEPGIDFRSKCTFALGFANERVMEELLTQHYERFEKSVKISEELDDQVLFNGEIDAICGGMPFELKSISSSKQYEKVFIKKEPKENHVVQLLTYMLTYEKTRGYLVYTNYIYHSKEKSVKGKRTKEYQATAGDIEKFKVVINEDGAVTINDNPTDFHLQQIVDFRNEAVIVLRDQEVSRLRPSVWGACQSCPFSKVCDLFDKENLTTEEFIEQCRNQVDIGG